MAQDFISWDDDDINLDLLLGDYTDYEDEKKSGSQVQNSPVYVCPACMKELKSISGFRGHVSQKHGLDKVKVFEKKPSTDIPSVLEDYLKTVAKTGKTLFPWTRLKVLFISKVEQVMEQFNADVPYDHLPPYPNVENSKYSEMQRRIVEAMQRFTGAPFTVQRICELVTQPRKHYTRCDKFLRGIEKNVMVVSTVDPSGKKIVSESSRLMVNGLDTNGFTQKQDLNEFTEGQPFSPMLQAGWANNAASMWPTSGMLDHVESLQKLSANVVNETSGAGINANGSLAIPAMRGNVTNNGNKFDDGRQASGDASHICATPTGFSALFQQKPHSEEPSNSNTGLAPLSGVVSVSDSVNIGPLRESEENESKKCESSEEDGGQVGNSEARVSGDGEASQESSDGKAQEVSSDSSEGKEVPPDPTDTEDGGPPEKKMRMDEDSTTDSSKESREVSPPAGEVTSQQDNTPKSADSPDATTTEAPQSSSAVTGENTAAESSAKSIQEADSKDNDADSWPPTTTPQEAASDQEVKPASSSDSATPGLVVSDGTPLQDAEQQQEVSESSSVCTDCVQQPSDSSSTDSSKEESEVSQSDLTAATPSTPTPTDTTATASTTPITSSHTTPATATTTSQEQNSDDQSAVSSSEDTDNSSSKHTQQAMDSSDNGAEAEVDQTDNNRVESDTQNTADQKQTCEKVDNDDDDAKVSESSERIQESSSSIDEGNNEVSGSSDSGETMSEGESGAKSADEGQGQGRVEDESGCSSAGEMMETDSGTEEKSGAMAEDGGAVQSTTTEEEGQEPMDQE